jgi:amidase
LTEIFFTEALEKAQELDEIYSKTGKPTGPLFGMPISLKDQFQIKGTGTHIFHQSCREMTYV